MQLCHIPLTGCLRYPEPTTDGASAGGCGGKRGPQQWLAVLPWSWQRNCKIFECSLRVPDTFVWKKRESHGNGSKDSSSSLFRADGGRHTERLVIDEQKQRSVFHAAQAESAVKMQLFPSNGDESPRKPICIFHSPSIRSLDSHEGFGSLPRGEKIGACRSNTTVDQSVARPSHPDHTR
ncbi:hypothetical protein VTI74DRAFT_5475 [Chaetomium olivicolor]